MIQEGRRKFLRFIGASAVAAPAAVKETAAAMGLMDGVASGGRYIGGGPVPSLSGGFPKVGSCKPSDPILVASEVIREKARIAALFTDETRERVRREAQGSTVVLDSDIAAMRSPSPAAKRLLQIERNIDRRLHGEKSWIERNIRMLLGEET